ncbi:pectinesterase inhibitor 10-like [Hibiscus syriacus]|uniref:pectinesterase inhibitor 10-like n=1 Tax=Hibiscus syriacus TaxID=106335 RepID=UPI001924A16B|nr:pectinesterase inhibitor 10-like [Hibiscus syriacus]
MFSRDTGSPQWKEEYSIYKNLLPYKVQTLHPNLCFTSFAQYATRVRGSPRSLATTALSLAFNTTRFTTKSMISISKRHGLKRREAAVLRDCVEQLGDSVDGLKDSIAKLRLPTAGNSDVRRQMNDILTWVACLGNPLTVILRPE